MDSVKLWALRAVAALASALCDGLNRRHCQHVVQRQWTFWNGIGRYHVLRCGEPSDPRCIVFHCAEHCGELCCDTCDDDGPEGDEEEAEPAAAAAAAAWTPKKDANGRVKIEA